MNINKFNYLAVINCIYSNNYRRPIDEANIIILTRDEYKDILSSNGHYDISRFRFIYKNDIITIYLFTRFPYDDYKMIFINESDYVNNKNIVNDIENDYSIYLFDLYQIRDVEYLLICYRFINKINIHIYAQRINHLGVVLTQRQCDKINELLLILENDFKLDNRTVNRIGSILILDELANIDDIR